MADRIKGITIELDGDTTKLSKALAQSNREIKNSQTALRDIDKLLQFDPGNTQLLQQKFQYLSKEIDATKDKLNALREAETQATQALANGTITQQDFDGLQREIVETEQELKNLEQGYGELGSTASQQVEAVSVKMETLSDKMRKVGDSMQSVGSSIQSVGSSMTKNITVPIAGIGTASVAAWNEVDEAMDTVTKKTGASGDELKNLQNITKKIAQTVPSSFQEAADAVGEVNTRFKMTGDVLERTATQFVKFSKLNKTDVSTSIDQVQSAMAAFNIPAEQATEFLDVLNAAGQETGASMSDLTSLMAANAASLKEMGYSASDSALLLANLSVNGVDASSAMTGLKKAYAESLKEGTSMSNVLLDLENRLKDSSTQADASAEAIELFGTRSGGALVEAISNGRLSFEALNTLMSDYAGSVSQTFEETQDPLDKMQTTLNTLKTVGADIVETSGPMLTEFMGGLTDVVRDLADAWDGLTEDQKEMIIKLAGIAAVAGPVITILGTLTSSIGSIVGAGSKVVGAFGSIGTAISGIGGNAGTAASTVSTIGNAAGQAAGPVSSAGTAMGTLAQNAVGFLALGAGILMAAGGISLLAYSAVKLADAGPEAAFAMVALIGSIALLAAGAAALGPALTPAAPGLLAFGAAMALLGAAVALVGTGIFLASSGLSIIIEHLPELNTYGPEAAKTFFSLSESVSTFAVAAGVGGGAAIVLGGGLLVVAGGMAAMALAAVGLSGGAGLLAVAITALSGSIIFLGEAILLATTSVVDSFNLIKSTVFQTLDEIIGKLTGTFDGVKGYMSGVLEWLKGIFNFEWSLPKIKLPHFSISGSFSLDPPSIPSIGVEWYRKAMAGGMILDSPTIFGMSRSGTLLGGGEAGPEAVVGTGALQNMVMDAVMRAQGMGGDIIMPIYVGGEFFDEKVIRADQIHAYRSGGR